MSVALFDPDGAAEAGGTPAPWCRLVMTVDAVGGVWRYAMELAGALRAEGIVTVFAGLGPRPSPAQAAEAQRIGSLVWLDMPLDWTAGSESDQRQLPRMLTDLAEEHGADLLHLNAPSQAADLPAGIPVIAVSHSCVVSWWHVMRGGPLPADWRWQERVNRRGFARADRVVAPSRSHADLLGECYGPLPLGVVHNAIGAVLDGDAKEPFVFAAGRWWDEAKNIATLDAAGAACAWPVRVAGPIVGPNGQTAAIANVEHLGDLPHADVLALVRRAGILVSPSLYEPFGLAALEGARAGAALVLADIATYRELWDGAALFFDPADPGALAAALDRLAGDPGLRAEMSRRALARSQRFVPDRQACGMAALCRGLLGVAAEAGMAGA